MINVEEILNEVKGLQDFQKKQVQRGNYMLDCVCCDGFGNIPREIMRMCLDIYIKQDCKNGKHTYQDAVRLVALHKYNSPNRADFIKWLGSFSEDFYMLRASNIHNCCDDTKENIMRVMFSLIPKNVKINVKELITDLNKIFDEEERYLENKNTTVMKWQYRITDVPRKKLSENDKYRLEQLLDGNETIEPMTIDVESIEVNVPDCLKN